MSASPLVDASWYVARGTGVVDLVLLTVVMGLGITTRSGRTLPGLPRFAVTAVHRSGSLLALALLTIHVTTLLVDPYAQLRLLDLIVPFGGRQRPLWLGLGTLAFDVLLGLAVTSQLRQRIGRRTWRAVHWSAYALWPLALAHGLGNGTDNGRLWLQLTAGACAVAMVAALAWRLAPTFDVRRRARPQRLAMAPPPRRVPDEARARPRAGV